MSDVIFIAVVIAFFVLCALYVQLCDHMIGSDDLALSVQGTDTSSEGEMSTPVTSLATTSAGATE
jgi:hypothetical protein